MTAITEPSVMWNVAYVPGTHNAGGSAAVTGGPPLGYRLSAEFFDDGLHATAPAVREADGLEVTVRVVVVALTKPQLRRLRDEAAELDRALSEQNNPYVLPLRDHNRDEKGRLVLVTDRKGPSLGEELTTRGPLPVREALAAAREVATGLELLHRADIVHRAVGPATLLRRPTGRVVLDCPPLPLLVEIAATTSDGTGHEPPEVLSGEDWTPRSDIYALASTLCTLLTGRSPLTGTDRDERLPLLPATAARLGAVLRQALATDPAARPASMAEFGRMLRAEEGVGGPSAEFPRTALADTDGVEAREFGGYLLLSKIGTGSTGEVWRARPIGGGDLVAVKVLHPHLLADYDVLARLLREGLLPLQHRYVVRVIDLYISSGKGEAGVVMDLVEGADLQLLLRNGDLGRAEGMRLLAEVATGLAAAHALDIVHRDVKPANILVRETDGQRHALLSDFGLVKALGGPTVTQVGHVPGTPAYLAPELVNGHAATTGSDLYALGVTAYEILAGRRPFLGTTAEVLHKHHQERPPRPPGLPDQAWAFLAACLAKDPRRRPTAADAAVTLRELAREIALDGPELPHDVVDPTDPVVVPAYAGFGVVPDPFDPFDAGAPGPDDAGMTRSSVFALEPPTEPAASRPRTARRWFALAGGVVLLAVAGNGIGILIANSRDDPDGQSPAGSTTSAPPKRYVPVRATVEAQGDVANVSWPADTAELPGLESFLVRDDETLAQAVDATRFSYSVPDPEPGTCYRVFAVVRTDQPPDTDEKPQETCLPAG